MILPLHRRQQPAASQNRVGSPVRLRAGTVSEDGTFSGYGSVFGVVDTFNSIVMPGAFTKSIARHTADGTMPKGLWQHNTDEPIAVWTSMREDEHGLYCEGRLILEVGRAREAHALLKANAVDGLSIGFEILADEWANPEDIESRYGLHPCPVGYSDDRVQLVTEIDLWEVSIVTFPSCAPARVVSVRKGQLSVVPELLSAIARRQSALGEIIKTHIAA